MIRSNYGLSNTLKDTNSQKLRNSDNSDRSNDEKMSLNTYIQKLNIKQDERIPTLKSINLEHDFNEESFLDTQLDYAELTIQFYK